MNSPTWPVFVTYWPCGKCVSGFHLDRSRDWESGPLLAAAIREGRKAQWISDDRVGTIYVKNGCDCSAEGKTEVQK